MKSKIPDDLLSAFLDREVTPAEEAAAKTGLQASPQAKQELQDYQRLSEWLHELPRQTVPPEFASAVMQRAERETLIPLDAAGIVNDSHLKPPSRRAWILTAAGAVAAAVLVLFFVILPGRKDQPGEAFALKAASTLPARRDNSAEVAFARPVAPASPVRTSVVGVRVAEAGVAGPALSMAAPGHQRGGTSASAMHQQSADKNARQMVFPADLKTAQLGDVIEALENVGDQVAIVRLMVVNQTAGLAGFQSLLVRDTSRPVQGAEKARLLRERFAGKKRAVSVEGRKMPNATGDLVCVFVEGSREELAGVLRDVENESHIQKAQLTNTISAAKLAQYANRPVAPSDQKGEHSASRARTVLSLPVAIVDKIFADREPAAAQKAGAHVGAVPALAGNDNFSYENRRGQRARGAPADGRLPQQATAQRIAGTKSQTARAEGRHVVATAQRSYQVFFVIDDQSITQSQSAAEAPAAPENAIHSGTATEGPAPPAAQRPVKVRAPVPADRAD